MALDCSVPNQLRLRCFEHLEVWQESNLTDPSSLSVRLVDYFCARLLAHWVGDIELETTYILAARKLAPYQKKIVIRYTSSHYSKIEAKLGVRIAKERLEGFGTRYFMMNGQIRKPAFTALLELSVPTGKPLTLLSTVSYRRLANIIIPVMVDGQIELEFIFPKAYFEATPERGIHTIIIPPAT